MTHRITVVRSDWMSEGYSEAERTTLGFGLGHDMEFGPEFSLAELWKLVYYFQCNYNALGNPDCVWDVRLESGEDCEVGVNWTEIPPSPDDMIFDLPDLAPNGEDGDYYRGGEEHMIGIDWSEDEPCAPDEEHVTYLHEVEFVGYDWKLLYEAQNVYDPNGMVLTSCQRGFPKWEGWQHPSVEDVEERFVPNEVVTAARTMAAKHLAECKQRVEQEAWESKTLAQNK